FERIHRSNLVGMGVVPLEFTGGDTVASLGLTGREVVEVAGLAAAVEGGLKDGGEVTVRAVPEAAGEGSAAGGAAATPAGSRAAIEFKVKVRLDTPQEVQYYRHGGILHYVLRQLVKGARAKARQHQLAKRARAAGA